jgi:hypothetical protein
MHSRTSRFVSQSSHSAVFHLLLLLKQLLLCGQRHGANRFKYLFSGKFKALKRKQKLSRIAQAIQMLELMFLNYEKQTITRTKVTSSCNLTIARATLNNKFEPSSKNASSIRRVTAIGSTFTNKHKNHDCVTRAISKPHIVKCCVSRGNASAKIRPNVSCSRIAPSKVLR